MEEKKKQKFKLIIIAMAFFVVFNLILVATSFMWMMGFIINTLLMIVLTLYLLISMAINRNSKDYGLKIPFVIFSIFWFCFLLQIVVKSQIERSTEKKAEMLVSKLEVFKEREGSYPMNLDHPDFSNLDLSHILNSKIQYEFHSDLSNKSQYKFYSDTFYKIKFPSFNQSFRIYSHDGWYSDDD